ncbi:PAS domain S-box protein [Desulfococcaceae bacterium HSG7]|nr:PAS domain S-box protein [Desulfococcaceae bacterium HSG7]
MNTEHNNNFPSGNILVVDDNRSNLKLLVDILQSEGYLVRAADDGELALRSVEAKLPDLILLDYQMPGIDGFEVCRRLKADPATRNIPIIFISAYGDTDLKVNALNAGGVDYVTKPFEKREVLARIHTHLSMYHLQQRLTNQTRELNCLYSISKLVEEEHSLDAILKGAANIICNSWIHPEIAGVQINIEDRSFRANNFKKTRCLLSHKVIIAGQNIGTVDIYFLEKRLSGEEEPFFVEERNLINAISSHLGRIIERIRVTEALQASERFSNKILQSSLNGLYIYDLNKGRNIFINRQYTKITGYSLEDIIFLKPDEFAELFHPDDLPYIIDHIEKIKQIDDNEFNEIEYRFKATSGKWVWCLSRDAVFQRSESGEVEQFIGSFIDITERKKTEQALRESEDTTRVLMEAIPEAIFLLDTEGVALAVNAETARRIKKTPDEIIGKCIFDFIPPDLAQERRELIGHAIHSGEIVKFTDTRAGNYIENHIHPLRDSSGKVNRVAVLALDVTEKKKAEKEQLRAVADYTYNWESWLAPDGALKWVNPAVERLTGFSIADCVKMEDYPLPILHEEYRARFGEILRQALTEKSAFNDFDFRISKKDCKAGWMSASWQAINAENGSHLGLRISIRDITERKQAEKALESERQRLYSILDAIPAFIYLLAPDYTIRFANQYSIEHFGIPDGKACYRAIWGQDEPCDNCQTFKVFDTQKPRVWEYNSVLDSRIYEVSDHPFTDIDGTRLVFKLGIDITRRKEAEKALQKAHNGLEQRVKERTAELYEEIKERKHAETALKTTHAQLLHAEKLSAIGNLSASIAHEFNNPLQGVMNIIKGVRRRVALDKDEMELVNMAVKECSRMRDLIKSLRDFNRPTSGKIGSVDIHAAVDSLLLLGKKEYSTRSIKIEKRYAENLPLIKAVSDQIKQVFLNLLNNAAVACYKGGTITIQTEVQNQNVVVRFHDTGIGIKPEDKKHIFEPFFTTKPEVKGTGLGLSISYGIIKEHGGKITVNSTPEKGTTFSVTLPIEGGNNAAKKDTVG